MELSNHFEQTISSCAGTAVTVGTSVYDLPGIYHDTLINSAGCDSVIITTLIILPQLSDTTEIFVCNGDSIDISGNYYSLPGFYTDSTQNSSGCYDIQVIELKNKEPFYNQSAVICNGDSYSIGTQTYNFSGSYIDTLQSAMGCDSIIILDLEVLPDITHTAYVTICENEEYYFSGNLLTGPGTYTDTLLSANSCDSIVILHLTVSPNTHYHIYDTICEGDDYVFGGLHYIHSGIYTVTFSSSSSSCDSIVTLHLTVNPPPSVSVTSTPGGAGSEVVELSASSDTYPLTYLWESSGSLSNPEDQNTTVIIDGSTWITLTVTDEYGCTSKVSHYIQLQETSTLYAPNAVTPDDDEFNNVFRVYGTNITRFHIIVFDRWGEVIFESNDVDFIWDLTYKGKNVQDGVYVYKLFAVGTDNAIYDQAGHITVIR